MRLSHEAYERAGDIKRQQKELEQELIVVKQCLGEAKTGCRSDGG